MNAGGRSGRGGVVRRAVLRCVLAAAAAGLAACGLDAQPQPEPIPSDRLPDSLVQTPAGGAAGGATSPSPSG